jgi:hypothetical protein
MPIAEIAKQARCSLKSVKGARANLRDCGLWIAGPRGVFIPVGGLNSNQATEKTKRKQVSGTIKVPRSYHLVVSEPSLPFLPAVTTATPTTRATTSRPYQPDIFGAPVLDLAQYRRGLLPSDIAAAVRAEMRARGVPQEGLAGEFGISQPQLANVLARRFGLSVAVAERLLNWLRRAAA